MTWSTDTIAHGNQQNKRAHSFRKSIIACRPSKRHHIVLRKTSKSRTLDFSQRRYTLRSSSSFTVDECISEDATGTDKGSFGRKYCKRTSFKNRKMDLSSPCGSESGPKIMHHQVGRSSETSEILPSSDNVTDPLYIHSTNAEDDEETGTDKCSIMRNSWGRTPFKSKKKVLASPCSLSPQINHHQVGMSSETSEILSSSEDLTDPPHIHSANTKLELSVNQENLNSVSIGVCNADTDDLQPEVTITNLCLDLESKCGDGYSAVESEPCVLEADTRKATAATVSNLTVQEALGTGPEACIFEGQIEPCQEGSFSEKCSKEVNIGYKVGRSLERRWSTVQQYIHRKNYTCSKKPSIIGFAVSGSLDTGIKHPSFNDIYINVDISAASLQSGGVSSGEGDILPQDTAIRDLTKLATTTCSYTDNSSSAKVSTASGNKDTIHFHNSPTNSSSQQPLYRRHHRKRRVRAGICCRPRKILVLGDMMSGKSNLISAYCSDKYKEDYIPTILHCLQTDADVLGERINLVVIEISGRDDFQPLRRYAYHKMDAAIICYPVDSSDSFERIRNYWVPELRKHAPKAPFVVVGTKRDIRDEARDRVEEHKQKLRGEGEEVEMVGRLSAEAAFVKKFVSHDRGKRVSNDLGAVAFYECCSIYRDGTRKVFEGVAKIALQKSRRKRKMSSRRVDSICTII